MEVFQVLSNLISDSSKGVEANFSTTFNRCRIFEAVMNSLRVTGKYGARLFRVVANREHMVEAFARELIDRF